jgi:hypothetical protein
MRADLVPNGFAAAQVSNPTVNRQPSTASAAAESAARLVTYPQLLRLAELADQPPDRLGPDRRQLDLPAVGRFGNVPRLRISPPGSATATAIVSAWTSNPINRTPQRAYVLHGRLPFVCGSAPRFFPDPKRNPRFANREPVVPL